MMADDVAGGATLPGQVAIVTGASSGFGVVFAKALASFPGLATTPTQISEAALVDGDTTGIVLSVHGGWTAV